MASLWDGFQGFGEAFEDIGGSSGNYGLGKLEENYADQMNALRMTGYPGSDGGKQSFMQRMMDPKSWDMADRQIQERYGPGGYVPFGTSVGLSNPLIKTALGQLAAFSSNLKGAPLSDAMIKQLLTKYAYRKFPLQNTVGRGVGGQNRPSGSFNAQPSTQETSKYLEKLAELLYPRW